MDRFYDYPYTVHELIRSLYVVQCDTVFSVRYRM